MDEIACTSSAGGIRSPQRKRTRTIPGSRRGKGGGKDHDEKANDKDNEGGQEKHQDERPHIEGELGKVSADEFWERMSFRQECVAGAMSGFFTFCISTPPPVELTSQPSPLAPQPGQVSSKMVMRIVTTLMTQHEFSSHERAVRSTETLESAIKGLCDDAAVIPSSKTSASTAHREPSQPEQEPERPRTPEPEPDRRVEVPRTPPPGRSHLSTGGRRAGLPEISPNPFPDPVATPETYASHIYGTVAVRNPARTAKDGATANASNGGMTKVASQGTGTGTGVTVLAVRKKRKTPAQS